MKLCQSVLVKNWAHISVSVLYLPNPPTQCLYFLKEIGHSMSFHILGISCIKQVSSDLSNGNSKINHKKFGMLQIKYWNLKEL